ncbi:hypothetical protein ACFL13_00465 [Patescibacteria group bacterium]
MVDRPSQGLGGGVNRELNSFFTLLSDTERFSHFGTELNEGLKITLTTGEKLLALFNQPMGTIIDINAQLILFCIIWMGLMHDTDEVELRVFITKFVTKYNEDDEFKGFVNNMISSAEDFNQLMAGVGRGIEEIFSKLKYEKHKTTTR